MAEDYKLIDNEEKHRYEFQIDGKIVCSRIYSQTSGMEANCNAWYSY